MPIKRNKKKSEFDALHDVLLAKKEELNKRIEQLREEILMEHDPEDEAGIAVRNSSAGMAIANIERELSTLREIELSLRRMETGEYGTCGVCGEDIPPSEAGRCFFGRCGHVVIPLPLRLTFPLP